MHSINNKSHIISKRNSWKMDRQIDSLLQDVQRIKRQLDNNAVQSNYSNCHLHASQKRKFENQLTHLFRQEVDVVLVPAGGGAKQFDESQRQRGDGHGDDERWSTGAAEVGRSTLHRSRERWVGGWHIIWHMGVYNTRVDDSNNTTVLLIRHREILTSAAPLWITNTMHSGGDNLIFM